MKKRYILLKDGPELKKGAILEEKCEDGNQDYKCINIKEFSQGRGVEERGVIHYKDIIEKQPEWFEEVGLMWLTMEQIKKVKTLLKIK